MGDIRQSKQRTGVAGTVAAQTEDDPAALRRSLAELQSDVVQLRADLVTATTVPTEPDEETPVTYQTDPLIERRLKDDGKTLENHRRTIATMETRLSQIRTAKIIDVFDDYLECKWYSPRTEYLHSVTVFIAKPFILRQTPFDGVGDLTFDNGDTISYVYDTYRLREADDGSNTEDQVVTPDYIANEQILVVFGATGVTVGGVPLMWSDINTAARAWAEVAV